MIRRLTIYIVLITAVLAYMDWWPIHRMWWSEGRWPLPISFQDWAQVRAWTGTLLCPPCAALAENLYFAIMEVEAGEAEQADVLKDYAHYSGNPLLPDGARYWWGQGDGQGWRPVSMIAWFMYWTPRAVLWWWLYASDLFRGRLPWWIRKLRDVHRALRSR